MRQVEFVPLLIRENAEVFTIRIDGNENTEFSKMLALVQESGDQYIERDKAEVLKVLTRMTVKGVLESLFRCEGGIDDRICAIPLECTRRKHGKHGTLRLYCIRISERLLIVGSGGIKTTRTYEEDDALSSKVKMMQKIDKTLLNLENNGCDIEKDIYNLTIMID